MKDDLQNSRSDEFEVARTPDVSRSGSEDVSMISVTGLLPSTTGRRAVGISSRYSRYRRTLGGRSASFIRPQRRGKVHHHADDGRPHPARPRSATPGCPLRRPRPAQPSVPSSTPATCGSHRPEPPAGHLAALGDIPTARVRGSWPTSDSERRRRKAGGRVLRWACASGFALAGACWDPSAPARRAVQRPRPRRHPLAAEPAARLRRAPAARSSCPATLIAGARQSSPTTSSSSAPGGSSPPRPSWPSSRTGRSLGQPPLEMTASLASSPRRDLRPPPQPHRRDPDPDHHGVHCRRP